jgi:hypothetical protein
LKSEAARSDALPALEADEAAAVVRGLDLHARGVFLDEGLEDLVGVVEAAEGVEALPAPVEGGGHEAVAGRGADEGGEGGQGALVVAVAVEEAAALVDEVGGAGALGVGGEVIVDGLACGRLIAEGEVGQDRPVDGVGPLARGLGV